ncbi:MAG TPA: NAD(P)-dependent oxidoreductase [Mycobacteriales bacterium]|nr:NAD(P)-dependent oxidoreductase [Mycobacteriales bacterium]
MAADRPRERVVIFGGSGFIGTHLARRLAGAGSDVVVADIEPPRAEVQGVRYEYCDVRRPVLIDPAAEYDLAVNLAAVHRTPGHPDHEYYDTNVAGALNVTDWCLRSDVSRLCFTSSISVYGPGESKMDEQSDINPVTAYGRSKFLAEQVHRQWLETSGPDSHLVTVRPAVVFGPGENGNFTRLASALARGRFAVPGAGTTVKACGYVEDLVDSIQFALAEGEREILYNFCYPEPYTVDEVCAAFHEVAGYSLPKRIPQSIVDASLRARGSRAAIRPVDFLLQRVAKLVHSTHIEPANLTKRNFVWRTDLMTALAEWREASAGTFV